MDCDLRKIKNTNAHNIGTPRPTPTPIAIFPVVVSAESAAAVGLEDEDEDNDEPEDDEGEVIAVLSTFVAVDMAVDAVVVVDDGSVMLK